MPEVEVEVEVSCEEQLVNQQELVRDSKALLEEVAVREWFIIYSPAYIAIFTVLRTIHI
jgi:hypothetical protein